MTTDTETLRELARWSNDGVLRGPALQAADTIDAQAARIEARDIIVRSVAAALERHGVAEADDPGEAIDVLVADKDAEIKRLRQSLDSIRQYGADTLSGRLDGPDDRAWQREAVREMTKRARAALQGDSNAA